LAKNASIAVKPSNTFPKVDAIDSSLSTLKPSRLLIGLERLKAHIYVDLVVGAVKSVYFEEPKFSGGDFGLGDSEYWQIEFLKGAIRKSLLPSVRPKGDNSPNKILKALRWLFNKLLRLIYRLRGMVEAFIAKIFPRDNRLKAESKANGRKIILLAAILYNIYSVAEYLDRWLRDTMGLSLTSYIAKLAKKKQTNGINFYHTLAKQLLPTIKLEAN